MPSALTRRREARAAAAPFVSYAQHGEDAILWRALRDVRNGFYVDVGAESPDIGTVTRAFYERGWSGINIEPVSYWFAQLAAARPRDQNVHAACGAAADWVKLYEVTGTGLSTVREDYAQRHARELGYDHWKIEVPCVRLDSLVDGSRPVHFLKIDVEGSERNVLESIDLRAVRPWIILIEATEPNSAVPTHEQWEDLLEGYHFAHADPVNRYYVAEERAELVPRLQDEA